MDYKTISDNYKNSHPRLYVLAHCDTNQQNTFIQDARDNGYFAEPIRANCFELKLDNRNMIFDCDGSKVDINEYAFGKTQFTKITPRLSITSMSPDDAAYYYNWCPLECMLDHSKIPLNNMHDARIYSNACIYDDASVF